MELKLGMKAGLAITAWGVVSLALGSPNHLADVAGGSITGSWAFLVPLVALWIALGKRRTANGGTLTFTQGIGSGIIVSLSGALTSGLLFVLYTGLLNPGWRERAWAARRAIWEQAGVTPAEIAMGEAAVRGASTPFFAVTIGLVESLVVWLAIAVFVAALRRRSP